MKSVTDTNPVFGQGLAPRNWDRETAMVAAMHEKFGLGVARVPGPDQVPQPLVERVRCLQEELIELATACDERDFPGIADALVDLVVFAKGTAVQLGLPWAELFDDVMRANNVKVRGVGKRGHAVDLVKPPGWRGPQTEAILKSYGWQPSAVKCGTCGGGEASCPVCHPDEEPHGNL